MRLVGLTLVGGCGLIVAACGDDSEVRTFDVVPEAPEAGLSSSETDPDSGDVDTAQPNGDAGCEMCATSSPTNPSLTTSSSTNSGATANTDDVSGSDAGGISTAATSPVGETSQASTSPSGVSTAAGDAGVTSEEPDRWLLAAPLFSTESIASINIDLSPEAMDALRVDTATYVHGALQVRLSDGTAVDLGDLGVRLKGRWGSARSIDQKSAFLLKANEFVPGQRLFGMNKLALNNLVQDSSMVHEQLAYELFRTMGVPAPRTGFARVTVNGELKGLYATVEVVDNAEFLDHWFGSDDGNLYEGAYGTDLFTDLVTNFDQDRGDDVGFSDLLELAQAFDMLTATDHATFVDDVAPWVDIDAYVQFAATELFLSHWDGYAATRNNYFVYRPPGGQWHWLPWGTDQTFGDTWASVWRGQGRLQQLCEASLVCRQKLATAYGALIGNVSQLNLLRQVDLLEDVISEAAYEDPGKEYSVDDVYASLDQLRSYLRDRPSSVASDLRCTDPSNVDEDGDGASGCGDDCNDWDSTVYPGAAEACNLIDDDCNGQVDDADGCPSCVTETDTAGTDYAFCFRPLDYWSAQYDCQAQGGELASIHDQPQNDWMAQTLSNLNVGGEWWIGINDAYSEGTFVWEDGSTVDYTNWAYGEPNDAGGYEDCGELTWSWQWNDLPCGNGINYICRLP